MNGLYRKPVGSSVFGRYTTYYLLTFQLPCPFFHCHYFFQTCGSVKSTEWSIQLKSSVLEMYNVQVPV